MAKAPFSLQAYKEKRISEREYFERMNKIKEDYQKGDSGIEYPESIKNEPNAQAFYGVTAGIFNEECSEYRVDNQKEKINKEQLAELSILIEKIVSKHTKVDWHENTDVHNRIDQEVEDLIFDFAEVSKKRIPYSSAKACPLVVSTNFSLIISHLFPMRILSTLSAACCSILRIQLRIF